MTSCRTDRRQSRVVTAIAQCIQQAIPESFVFIGVRNEVGDGVDVVANAGLELPRYELSGTPCEVVLERGELFVPTGLCAAFPNDEDLVEMGADAYIGASFEDPLTGRPGLIAVVSRAPIDQARTGVALIHTFADCVRESRRAAQQQQRSEELNEALDAASDCVFTFEPGSLRFVYSNQAASDQVGYTGEELRSMTPIDIKPQFDEVSFRALVEPLIAGQLASFNFETIHRHRNGHDIPVEIALKFVPTIGRAGQFVAIVRDVSERNAVSERLQSVVTDLEARSLALEEERKRAEAASRAKSEFLANMSHEIRTPMTAILGFADLLEDDHPEIDRLETVATIRRNGEHLLSIINDILDLSKIESGKMTIENRPTDWRQLVDDVVASMRVRSDGKGIGLRAHYGPIHVPRIETDDLRLRQILVNLVGNAIKFTEVGEVVIDVRPLGWDTAKPQIEFAVRDTGIGLTPEQQERIFDAFEQADTSTTRRFGGTGLGLKISTRLAEMLGGSIEVSSEPGRGSVFALRVASNPVSEALSTGDDSSTVSAVSLGDKPLAGRKILYAEDGPDNQRLVGHHLRRAGAELVIVDDGQEAVERVEAEEFELILMDMQMPRMDGYEATRTLRSRGVTLPIVALTAHAMDGDRQSCINAGCDAYLSKPIDKTQLLEMCARFIAGVSA